MFSKESLHAPLVPRSRAPVCRVPGCQPGAQYLVPGTRLYDINKEQRILSDTDKNGRVQREELTGHNTRPRVPPWVCTSGAGVSEEGGEKEGECSRQGSESKAQQCGLTSRRNLCRNDSRDRTDLQPEPCALPPSYRGMYAGPAS